MDRSCTLGKAQTPSSADTFALAEALQHIQSGPRPTNKHTTAHLPTIFVDNDDEVPISGIHEGMAWLADQVAQRQRPEQPCILLMDGQPTLWEAAEVSLGTGVAIEILDIIHVSTAALFTTTEASRKSFARERLLRILQGQVSGVIRGLRRMGKARLIGQKLNDLQRICGYLESNQSRMQYDKYLAVGYLIASGVIDGPFLHIRYCWPITNHSPSPARKRVAGHAQTG